MSRSTTIRSLPSQVVSSIDGEVVTWCPAADSCASTFEPSIRSAEMLRTLAMALSYPLELQRAPLAELFADALRPAPHLHDLRSPLPHLGHPHLPLDPGVIEPREHGLDRLRRSRVAEAVGDQQAPLPALPRVLVDLRVHLAEGNSG